MFRILVMIYRMLDRVAVYADRYQQLCYRALDEARRK